MKTDKKSNGRPDTVVVEQEEEVEVETHATSCATFFVPAVLVFVIGLFAALIFFATKAW